MASTAGPATVRTAVRANVTLFLGAVDRHRLRLADLPPTVRGLAAGALVATAAGAGLLAIQPLDVALPGGEVGLLRSDAPVIGRADLAISLLAVAVACAAIAAVAALSGSRWWRLAVVGVSGIGLLMLPSVVVMPDVSPVSTALGLGGLVAAVALAVVGVVGRPRSAVILAALAAIPPVAALLSVFAALLPGAPPGSEQELATSILGAATVAETPVVALGVWGVIEYGRGLTASSRSVLAWEPKKGWFLPVVLALKLGALAAIGVGISVELVGFDESVLQPAFRESLPSIAWAAGLTVLIGWWLLHGSRPSFDGAGISRASWLVFVPLLIGYVLPTVLFGLLVFIPNRFGLVDEAEAIRGIGAGVRNLQTWAQALAPVVAAVAALVGGIGLARWGGRSRSGIAWFLLAFAAWTLVPAISGAMNTLAGTDLSDRSGGPLGFVHPVTLDLFVTALAVVLAVAWYAGLQRRVTPAQVAAIVLLSTVLAYGGIAFGGELGVLLFWLAFAFPAVAQFVFDARELNDDRPDRGARVLKATGLSALAIGTVVPMVALDFVGPGGTSTADLARALFLVPFVAVLLGGLLADG